MGRLRLVPRSSPSRVSRYDRRFTTAAVIVGLILLVGINRQSVMDMSSAELPGDLTTDKKHAPPSPSKYYIFCYGDSLTAGMTLGGDEYFPYANSLQQSLREENVNATVSHVGLPGWTTTQLIDVLTSPQNGLLANIKAMPSPDLVILLAGTNDLGRNAASQDIQNNLIRINREALLAGARHTMILEIPESRWQFRNDEVRLKVRGINAYIQAHYEKDERTTFAPFAFGYNASSGQWSADGLHMSAQGYNDLGKYLAPIVARILRNLD